VYLKYLVDRNDRDKLRRSLFHGQLRLLRLTVASMNHPDNPTHVTGAKDR
jgi:hypothetical protein